MIRASNIAIFFCYSGMTTVKLSDFNEPTNSMIHVKSEDESDEEHPNQLGDSGSAPSTSTANRKRYNFTGDLNEDKPEPKKRYRFE